MSITIVTNLLSGHTGLDKSAVMTANALHRRGYTVSILNLIGPGNGTTYLAPRWPLDPGIAVSPLQTLAADRGRRLAEGMLPVINSRIQNLNYSFTRNGLCALRDLNSYLGSDDAIVFTHPLQSWAFAEAIGDDRRSCRTVLQVHGDYTALYPELMDLLRHSRHVVDDIQTVSSGLGTGFADEFTTDRIHWIPNIHEPADITPVTTTGVTVAHVGSFQDTRNQLDSLRMMQRLDGVDDVHLVLWGNYRNKYGEHARTYAETNGLSDRVTFAGIGTEQDIYGSADIVIIPSRSEGFGYPLFEAAASGVPVVAYDYDYGPRDVIEDGVSGFIVPPGDVDRLAQRVRELAESPALRSAIGSAAATAFHSDFSPERIVDRYDELLGDYAGGESAVPFAFEVDGADPVLQDSVTASSISVRGKRIGHVVRFSSTTAVRDVRIQSSVRTRRVRPVRIGRNRYALFVLTSDPGRRIHRARQRVVSYAADNAQLGRFYLGNTTNRRQFEIGRHLLRSPDVVLPSAFMDIGSIDPDAQTDDSPFEVDRGILRLPVHPRQSVVSGTDDQGVPINTVHGVALLKDRDVRRPSLTIDGEFDSVEYWLDGVEAHTFSAPFDYRELFDRVLEAEREHGLFDYEVLDGVHPWELYRAALIASLCEALGFWGKQFSPRLGNTWDVYMGGKSLHHPGDFNRVVFEFTRKPDGPDSRTLAFQTPDSLIVEYPQSFGYGTGVYTDANRYPVREYHLWRLEHPIDVSGVIDPEPFERALRQSLGFPVRLSNFLDTRLEKFLHERDFWTRTFEQMDLSEVIVPSSHWSAGICEAARRSGAVACDVQYALTSEYHPSYWFGQQPHHGAQKLYSWSKFWHDRVNGYTDIEVAPRSDLILPGEQADSELVFDVCVVSQPRVSRRIFSFVRELTLRRPELRVCIAPHPDERLTITEKVAQLTHASNVTVAARPTIEAIQQSEICVGAYSTSLYEAAYLGKPTWILPVPGHEIVAADIESGLFRLLNDVDELATFDVPEWRHDLFDAPTRPV